MESTERLDIEVRLAGASGDGEESDEADRDEAGDEADRDEEAGDEG